MHQLTVYRLTFLAESLRIRQKSSEQHRPPRHIHVVLDYLVNIMPANSSEVQDLG